MRFYDYCNFINLENVSFYNVNYSTIICITEKRNLKISQEIFDSNRCLEDDWKTLEILLERCTFKATYRK